MYFRKNDDHIAADSESKQIRAIDHKFLIKRPVIKTATSSSHSTLANGKEGESSATTATSSPNDLLNIFLEKRRFELFIDLIWVGIIGNLAESFAEGAYSPDTEITFGASIWNFIILFVTAWRFWQLLQEFMTRYHTNDLVERAFVVWILILAVVWGNNAIYLFQDGAKYIISAAEADYLAIVVYLIARASFLVLEGMYAIWLPCLRKPILLRLLTAAPVSAAYIGAIYADYPLKAGLVMVGSFIEYWLGVVGKIPAMRKRLLVDDQAYTIDLDHWIDRIRDFFIIILGDGVLNLIRGSPLGRGLHNPLGVGILVLGIYYAVCGLYFNGDLSRVYCHAAKRGWWRAELWLSFHVVMFYCTLMLQVSLDFMIQHGSTTSSLPLELDHNNESEDMQLPPEAFMYTAKWSVSSCLSIVLICLSCLTFLSSSLDTRGTLKVDSRYLRLLPRLGVVIIVMLIPIARGMTAASYVSIVFASLAACLTWEWFASLEKKGAILEGFV